MEAQEVEFEGHLIDSMIMSAVFGKIMDLGGEFKVLEFRVGTHKQERSYARMLVMGRDRDHLDSILRELHRLGAKLIHPREIMLEPAPADRVPPEGFYSTTHHPSFIYYKGRWIQVPRIRMDHLIVIRDGQPQCIPISMIKAGDLVVVGNQGVRVIPPERPRQKSVFEFMVHNISSERPLKQLIPQIASEIHRLKRSGSKIGWVCGPAVVHTGALESMAKLIRLGYVDLLLAGNALAVHDIEYALLGTSLGMDISTGEEVPGGHRHHLYAIAQVYRYGSIRSMVESGALKSGIMYECIKHRIPFILCGSIRDDGPLPEVITDTVQAKQAMAEALDGVGMVVMLASALHSIAVGNLLSSDVKVICVDINPATIAKLMDRGTAQALGLVTDVGIFLPELARELERLSAEQIN